MTAAERTQAIDVDKSVDYLNKHASKKPTGWCARSVRKALEAGGADLSPNNRPPSGLAKDYGPYLKRAGLSGVSKVDYTALKGDVVVFQPPTGSVAGHMQMYNGSNWVSDFTQNHFKVWVQDTNYEIYRP